MRIKNFWRLEDTCDHRGEHCATNRGQIGWVRGGRCHFVKGVRVVDVVRPELFKHLRQEQRADTQEQRVTWVQHVRTGICAVKMAPRHQLGHIGFGKQAKEETGLGKSVQKFASPLFVLMGNRTFVMSIVFNFYTNKKALRIHQRYFFAILCR